MSLNRKPLNTEEDEMRLVQTPRKFPLSVPLVGVFDAPYKLILCNVDWWSHVSGMIDVLSALDAWTGDDDEKTRGIREIAKLLSTDWSGMFVENIRWDCDTEMLQMMILGEWQDVAGWDNGVDDCSFMENWIYPIENTANLANTRAINALAGVDALNGHNVEYVDPMLAEHETRIVALEECCETAQTDIAALQANAISQGTSIENLSTDLEALEDEVAALALSFANQNIWSEEFDFLAGDGGWSGGGGWTSGSGWLINSSNLSISKVGANVGDSRITFVTLQIKRASGTGFLSITFNLGGENAQEFSVSPIASGSTTEWMQINRINNSYTQELAFTGLGSGHSFYIEKVTYWGRGDNPF